VRTAQFQTKTGDNPLNIRQLLLIFIILIGGLMMAILAFAHEIYTARKERKRWWGFSQRQCCKMV
jgi:uncharacterized membrane protein YidH (DUF202 family)